MPLTSPAGPWTHSWRARCGYHRRRHPLPPMASLRWVEGQQPLEIHRKRIPGDAAHGRSGLNTSAFNEGHPTRGPMLAQTARRTTTLEKFKNDRQWRKVIRTIDAALVLTQHEAGRQSNSATTCSRERRGHMGSLMTLINRASSQAIRTGVEALTFEVLESTQIDVGRKCPTRRGGTHSSSAPRYSKTDGQSWINATC